MRLLLALLTCLFLFGCEGAALHEAETQDTPEAYEAFLQEHPGSAQADRLRDRIEALRFGAAQESGTSEALRGFLAVHPDGKKADEASRLEDDLAFAEAGRTGESAALAAYLDAHPDGAHVDEARATAEKLDYLPAMEARDVKWERINMAGDPKGELNGWAVTAEIHNGGDRTLDLVECAIDYLDATGTAVQTDTWWAVAKELSGFPVPPSARKPLPKNQSRDFRFSTAEKPAGFADQFAVRVTSIRVRR
jgi:hypothetical protein